MSNLVYKTADGVQVRLISKKTVEIVLADVLHRLLQENNESLSNSIYPGITVSLSPDVKDKVYVVSGAEVFGEDTEGSRFGDAHYSGEDDDQFYGIFESKNEAIDAAKEHSDDFEDEDITAERIKPYVAPGK